MPIHILSVSYSVMSHRASSLHKGTMCRRNDIEKVCFTPPKSSFEVHTYSHQCMSNLYVRLNYLSIVIKKIINLARLAQSVERKALNLVVVGSSPTVGVVAKFFIIIIKFLNSSSPFRPSAYIFYQQIF